MNINDVRQRLEALGAVMKWIVIVPRGSSTGGWKRSEKWNLVETDDGYVVSLYDRGRVGDKPKFDVLDDACRFIAERSRELEDMQRRYRESMGIQDEP